MKLMTATVAVAAVFAFAQSAHARSYHHGYRSAHHRQAGRHYLARHYAERSEGWWGYAPQYAERSEGRWGYASHYAERSEGRWAYASHYAEQTRHRRPARRAYAAYADSESSGYRGGYGRRPAAWCGWEMRQLVGSDPGPAFNLARNWAHWGRAGAPGIGAVVVWPHHVGKIVGKENGMWVVKSGNDGHRVRTRPLSIGRAIAIRWG